MYYSLRVTPAQFNCPFGLSLAIVKKLLKKNSVEKDMYILADEKLDKFGEPTHHHWHFNFISEDTKESLQRWITRQYAKMEYICKGNASYALTAYDEPEDLKRWYRYCMKEKWVPQYTKLSEFDKEELDALELCAKDERKTTISLNIAKRAKQQNKTTMFDKLEKHIDSLKKNLKTFRSINIEIIKYYVSQGHSLNVKTVDGYTNLYMIRKKLLSPEDFYDINH